jgi:hypothetical protein
MNTTNEANSDGRSANEIVDDVDEARREAMLRLAKYTAPVMLAMLVSEKAMAVSTDVSVTDAFATDTF